MFERILVPLDGSPRAELILSQVGRILRREDAEILLLRAVNIPSSVESVDMGPILRIEREAAQAYLQDIARRFQGSGAKVTSASWTARRRRSSSTSRPRKARR